MQQDLVLFCISFLFYSFQFFCILFFYIKLFIFLFLFKFSPMRINQSRKSSKSSSSSPIKKFIKKFNFKRRKNFSYDSKSQGRRSSSDFLCISQLEPSYKLFINQVFEHLLALQEANQRIHTKNHIQVIDEQKYSSPLSNTSFLVVEDASLCHFREGLSELSSSKLRLDSLKSLKPIDRFSSVLLVSSASSSLDLGCNYLSRIEIFEQPAARRNKLVMTNKKEQEISEQHVVYKKVIEPIQAEMMPKWSSMETIEQMGIVDLLDKWQVSVSKKFQMLSHDPNRENEKKMRELALNEARMIKKGTFRFDLARVYLERNQMELLTLSGYEVAAADTATKLTIAESKSLVNLDQQPARSIRPNTRLILKCFKQFIEAFECLSRSRQAKYSDGSGGGESDLKLYWSNLTKFNLHMSKAVLRCCFYVYENADLKRGGGGAAISLPPIYVLESNDCEQTNSKNSPNVKLESLYEYVYVCRSYLKHKLKVIKKNAKDEPKQQKYKIETLHYYKLILNCLIRLIQTTALIRENLVMKRINYDEADVCDIDIYSHYISNECRLVREYLKKILEIS
jgi:hypothetical protein